MESLRQKVRRIDGRGYPAYRDLRGIYRYEQFILYIDHVQGDPFASPSRMRVRVPADTAGFPADTHSNLSREIALRDYLTRRFSETCRSTQGRRMGSGKSGTIAIDRPGQEILERTSVVLADGDIEARFVVGLPAFGRRIAGRHAETMLCDEIPGIIATSLICAAIDQADLYRHIMTAEDADALRSRLSDLGFVAFVADGSVLPRRSGIDPRPAEGAGVVPFRSPERFRVAVTLPNRGAITGMGIPKGISLIVGGGYHGKSTLLRALELGIYNHIPGDGREFVVTSPGTVKIRAEDGRRIEKVDISPFITNLPTGADTTSFSTEDASGSTSQAANIIEALEAGADVLLIDEDTSATNFMIRDHRMQELVSKDMEPITPFIDKVRHLHQEYGVSTVLVIGGSGDYFDVADYVICMTAYIPVDMTAEAHAIAENYRTERQREGGESFGMVRCRIPLAESFDPGRGRRDVKITAKGLHTIAFGREMIDLSQVEQIVDTSQTRAVGRAIYYATRYMDGRRTMRDVVGAVFRDIEKGGFDLLHEHLPGDFAAFRAHDLAAAINRLRTLRVRSSDLPVRKD